jgi:hypothetical protein
VYGLSTGDVAGKGVVEGISDHLAADPIDLIVKDRGKPSSCAANKIVVTHTLTPTTAPIAMNSRIRCL